MTPDIDDEEGDPYAGYVPWWVNLLGMTEAEREQAVRDLYSKGSGDGKGGLETLIKDMK